MSTRNTILASVPLRNRSIMIKPDQDVQDIIRAITHYHKKHVPQYDQFAAQFNVGSERDIAKALWRFCRDEVVYKIEDEQKQTVRSAARILSEGKGDCKHYASFIAGVLDALKRQGLDLHWAYRFADYKNSWGDVTHHVFVVLTLPNGKEIWIDPVLDWFDYHLPYQYAITRTIDTMPRNKVGCLPYQQCGCSRVGATGDQYLPVPAGYPTNIPRPVLTADGRLVLRDNFHFLKAGEVAWVQKALQPLILQYAPQPYNIYWSVKGWGSGAGDILVYTGLLKNVEHNFLTFPPKPSGFDQLLIGLNDILPSLISAGANSIVPGSGGLASSIIDQGSGGNTSVNLSAAQLQALQQQQQASLIPALSGTSWLPWLLVAGGIYLFIKK